MIKTRLFELVGLRVYEGDNSVWSRHGERCRFAVAGLVESAVRLVIRKMRSLLCGRGGDFIVTLSYTPPLE